MSTEVNVNQPAATPAPAQPQPQATVSTRVNGEGVTRVTMNSDDAPWLTASGSAATSPETATHIRLKSTDGHVIVTTKGASQKLGLLDHNGRPTGATAYANGTRRDAPAPQADPNDPFAPQPKQDDWQRGPTPEMIAERARVQQEQRVAQSTNALIPPQLAQAYVAAEQALGQHNVEMVESRVLAALHASATRKATPNAFDPAQIAHATGKSVAEIAPHVQAIAPRVAMPLKAVADKLGMEPQAFFRAASAEDGGEALSIAAHAAIKGDLSKLVNLAQGMASQKITSTHETLQRLQQSGATVYPTKGGKFIAVHPNGSREFVSI